MAQLGLSKQPARAVMDKGAALHPVVIATGSAAEKANLAAARKAYGLFNKRDKALFALFADDVVERDQTMPADLVGKPATAESLGGLWQMASNGKIDMPVMFAAGDYVVAIGHSTGTNDGNVPAMGIKQP